MKTLQNAGRIVYSIPFLIFGINHIMHAAEMANYTPAWVPGKEFFVYLTGAAMIAAGVAFIIRKLEKIAGLLLALLLLIYIVAVHIPQLSMEQYAQMGLIAILKNLGLIGGALMIAGNAKKA